MPKDELLRKALEEQERELQNLDERLFRLNPLQLRRNNLFQLVSQMRFMLGMEPYRSPETPPLQATTNPIGEGKEAIWSVAKQILEQAKRPMSTAELTDVLCGLGFPQLVGRPGRETVRAVIAKKKAIFEKLADGNWVVRKALPVTEKPQHLEQF